MEPNNLTTQHLAEFLQKRLEREAQIEAEQYCQLWSDATELNHLEFTEMPPIPKLEIKTEKTPLSAGIWNFIRSSVYQLAP